MGKIKIDIKEQSIGIKVVLASIAALLFRGTLDIFYVKYIVRIYGGEFPSNDIGVVRLLESYIIALFLVICIASSLSSRSGTTCLLYCCNSSTTLYGLADHQLYHCMLIWALLYLQWPELTKIKSS